MNGKILDTWHEEGDNAEERTERDKLKKRININGDTGLKLSKSLRK
jgi:hypothetical protein